jgi:hypothetical protein
MGKAEQLQTADGVAKQEFAALDRRRPRRGDQEIPPEVRRRKGDGQGQGRRRNKAKKAAEDLAKGADES